MRTLALVAMVGAVAAWHSPEALAKPPLQLSGPGVRVEPLAIATARIENGKFVFGEWQEYAPAQSRGAKGYYYVFDCFGGWADPFQGESGYVNRAHSGLGAEPGQPRVPWDEQCFVGSSRWYFGSSYVCPLTVDDVQKLAPGATGGSPIDAIDVAWYWGGGECVLVFFTSSDSGLCWDGDPMEHSYSDGLAINFGEHDPGGYYYVNIDGVWSQLGFMLPAPAPGGSYLAALLNPDGSIHTRAGTQFMLWGTGDANGEFYRAGEQHGQGWDDDNPPNVQFGERECYEALGPCPDPLGKCIGFLGLRCPADLNWDGLVDHLDFEILVGWLTDFDGANDHRADLNADGFVNGDDFDAFASWFDAGC